MTIADICVERPVPERALKDIDLWTGWIAGALPCAGWETVIRGAGLTEVELAGEVDTFAGAGGEEKARAFGTTGYSIRARRPRWASGRRGMEGALRQQEDADGAVAQGVELVSATTKKIIALINHAADDGIRFLAFPETFLPGYPFWLMLGGLEQLGDPRVQDAYAAYLDAAVEIEGPEISQISGVAAHLEIFV
jgi:Carbon-nitrogen hydrolase